MNLNEPESGNMTCINEHAKWFEDAHRILEIARTPGLPLPSVTPTGASFNFTHIVHAEDARAAVATAETILSYAFKVEFVPWRPDPVGSASHYILVASLPSGLPLSIVALTAHFDGRDAREGTRKLVAAA